MSPAPSKTTVTVKLRVSDTFPAASVAVHVMGVEPTGNSELSAEEHDSNEYGTCEKSKAHHSHPAS